MSVENREMAKLNRFIDSIKENSLFRDFARNTVKALLLMMVERDFQRNDVVYSEGEEAEKMYIIKSGEFQVIISDLIKYRELKLYTWQR